MTPATLLTIAIAPGLSLLPARMDAPEARRMLVAIAIQESALRHRAQVPSRIARGWWQFEIGGGVAGVLRHRATAENATEACRVLRIEPSAAGVYGALEHCDALASVFARLLLWTLPTALPEAEADGWAQYLRAWRPGKPHPEAWPAAWAMATDAVMPAQE